MMKAIPAKEISAEQILEQRRRQEKDVTPAVAEIINEVRSRGDEALREYSLRFDGAALKELAVGKEEIARAREEAGQAFLAVLEEAAENIRQYHSCQKRQGFVKADKPGVVMGQKLSPLAVAGLYVPGGTAAYPSTVLMSAIPAKIAGVGKLLMCTPPGRDGRVSPAILAAASVAGVDNIYRVGGAQAVAAMAYGTESVPRADKIVGPGNIYVATAKKLVYGEVDIDMIAGPSDVLIVADSSANPAFVAADMLAQAEHDRLAAAVLLTDSPTLARQVGLELEAQLEGLCRREIAAASLENYGKIIVTESLAEAMALANALCPEHLEICTNEPFALLPLAQNAGSVFLGHYTPEALGDYFAGPNHTLPTSGTARFYSPLSVDDFVKKTSYLYYDKARLAKDGEKVMLFAEREGLGAHANSVALRLKAINSVSAGK